MRQHRPPVFKREIEPRQPAKVIVFFAGTAVTENKKIYLERVDNTSRSCTSGAIHGLLTKCEVKMAGYIGEVSFFAHLRTETESSHLVLTKQDFYGFRENFSCRTRREFPCGQDSSILPALVANHSTGFGPSCPLIGSIFSPPTGLPKRLETGAH